MATMEPPRYVESFQEFEVPSYSASIQQLQNLPPPLTEEPSLMDSSINPYEMQPTNSMILMDNSEISTPPPPYETTNTLGEQVETVHSHVYVNSNPKPEPPMDQNSQVYYSGEVEDKIKEILTRYNPPTGNIPRENPVDVYNNRTANHTFDAPQSQPPARQPSVQKPAIQYQSSAAAPKTTFYPQTSAPIQQPQTVAPQPQLRARVVQNVPANPPVQSASYQRYQPQVNYGQPHSAPASPQISQQLTSVNQPHAVHQQSAPVHQQSAPVHQQSAPTNQQVPQVYQAQPTPAQVTPYPQAPTGQADPTYLQLVQQQAFQFQLQTNQIQNLQNIQSQQSKEVLDKMQAYFEKISSFMERSERRLANLEQTAQAILKKGGDDVSAFMPKGELESQRKMMEQLETDFDLAKRLQAEINSKEKKEEKKKEKKEKRSSSSSNNRSSSSSSSMQECPICTLKVPFADLELHVNQCLESIEKAGGDSKDATTQEKASFWRRVFGPGPKKNADDKEPKSRPALPAPPVSNTTATPTPMPNGMYPNGQDFYQMPFVYRGGYPQPQMVPPNMYPYPGQQIYYIPNGMAQPNNQGSKK